MFVRLIMLNRIFINECLFCENVVISDNDNLICNECRKNK